MKKNSFGFTLIELVACLVILGIVSIFVMPKYSDQGVNDIVDKGILKDSIRQTIMRSMSDLSGANWNINVASKVAQVRKNTNVISSYNLTSYSGSFNIYFNNLGQPQSTPTLPYSITIESETGYVP